MKISAATFIRNNYIGAFCLYESMAMWLCLPHVEDMHILDLGSTDGTRSVLQQIANSNPRVHVHSDSFSHPDASAFANAANDCIAFCDNDTVLFWQADEIIHENLLLRFAKMLDNGGVYNLSFWRYQLRENFQKMQWYPHLVHRIGKKANFVFVGDGMNTAKHKDHPVCSGYDGGWGERWGKEYKNTPTDLPTHQMILDVSSIGAFRDNVPNRRKLHLPFWHELPEVEGLAISDWMRREVNNPNWTRISTPFNIPKIMRWHLGKTRYYLLDDLLMALTNDTTGEYVNGL